MDQQACTLSKHSNEACIASKHGSHTIMDQVNKLGQSCAKLCSSFGSCASNNYTLTVGWVAGWVAGWFNCDYIAKPQLR